MKIILTTYQMKMSLKETLHKLIRIILSKLMMKNQEDYITIARMISNLRYLMQELRDGHYSHLSQIKNK